VTERLEGSSRTPTSTERQGGLEEQTDRVADAADLFRQSNGGPNEYSDAGQRRFIAPPRFAAVALEIWPTRSPKHIERAVDRGCFRPRVGLQDLDHQGA